MRDALRVLGMTAAVGEPVQERPGRWLVTFVVRVAFQGSQQSLTLARLPLLVKSALSARASRHEALGILGREPGQVYAQVTLPAGRVWVALEEAPSRRWRFDVAEDGRPPKTLCAHRNHAPTWMESRLWMADAHATSCGVQRVRVQACCRILFSAWREFQGYDLGLYLPLEGPVRMINGVWQGVVPKGSYLVSNPVDHTGPADDQRWPVTYVKIVISQSVLKGVRERLALPRSLGPFDFAREPRAPSPALKALFHGWGTLLDTGDDQGLAELARAWSSALVVTLLREHPNQLMRGTKRGKFSIHHARFAQAVRLLQERLASPPYFEHVAREVGLSGRAFRRLFREETGGPPIQFLQHLRMIKAQELLKDSSRTLESIAREVGYEDVRAFGKMFQKHAHQSPRWFRT